METEENLEKNYWSQIPKETDILLTHGPAYQHLDVGQPQYGHIGCKTLTKRIEELEIPYVVHGHIHGGYGLAKTDKTTYINCSVTNEDYRVANKPIVMDLEK